METVKSSQVIVQCASCKKIRNDNGKWVDPPELLEILMGSYISHGICKPCAKKLYPEYCKDLVN